MRIKYLFIIGFVMLVSSRAYPAEDFDNRRDELTQYFYRTFTILVRGMERLGPEVESFSQEKTVWNLTALKVRVRPKIGFSIPAIGDLKLVPETEITWGR